jgi:DNA end-binding protein Ku
MGLDSIDLISIKATFMRSFWKGTISFGLINIPVSLHSASREHELKFKLLHKKDLSEIRYARICKTEDKEVPYEQIVKAVEKNGRYVVMSEDDFKKAEVEKSSAIEIVSFCKEAEIDTIYFEKPYFLMPEKDGAKAYFLLHQALNQTKKVAVAHYTIRNRNHVAVIKGFGPALVLNQLRFYDEIVPVEELELDTKIKTSPKEVQMATMLIEQLEGKFDAEQFQDLYARELKKTISQKAKTAKAKPKEKAESTAKVYDMMALLKASLEKKKAKAR